jgi:ribulose 1,5-bisphosphate synthetase/thiazole synthase
MVAIPAKVSIWVPTIKDKLVVVLGEKVEAACLVEKTGHPAPTLSIILKKSPDIVRLGVGNMSRVSHYPTMEEDGFMFICK